MKDCSICCYCHDIKSDSLQECLLHLIHEGNVASVIKDVREMITATEVRSVSVERPADYRGYEGIRLQVNPPSDMYPEIPKSVLRPADYNGYTTKPFKQKDGKLRFDLIPPEMDLAFAEVATFGIDKLKKCGIENPDRNWEAGLKLVSDHLAAMKRHVNKWERGIDNDEESGILHLNHALWHIAAMVTMIKRGRTDLDDRVKV